MKKFILFVFLLVITIFFKYPVFASEAAPTVMWNQTDDGWSGNYAYGIGVSSDGYVFVCGKYYFSGNYTEDIIRYSSSGVLWTGGGVGGWGFANNSNIAAKRMFLNAQQKPVVAGCGYSSTLSATRGTIAIVEKDMSDAAVYFDDDYYSKSYSWNAIATDGTYVYVTGERNGLPGNYITRKYQSNCQTLQWTANCTVTTTDQEGRGITLDSANNVYICGNKNNDYFIRKYDNPVSLPTGEPTVLATQTYDSGGTDIAYDIAIDTNTDSVYVTGNANNKMCTIKYDSSLNQIWVSTYTSGAGYAVALDKFGNVYVAGTSDGGTVYRLIKYDPDGNELWNIANDSTGSEEARDITVDDNGYVYVTGNYTDGYVKRKTIKFRQGPAVPSDITGVALSTSIINWQWKDNETTETSYKIYTSTWGLLQTLGANTTYWPETNLSGNTLYSRYFVVTNAVGSSTSTLASAYTFANAPTNLTKTGVYPSSSSITWDNVSATRYAVERSTDPAAPVTWSTLASWSDVITGTTYYDTGLMVETTHWYRVKSYNGDAVLSGTPSNTVMAYGLPTPATGVYMIATGTSTLYIGWTNNSSIASNNIVHNVVTGGNIISLGSQTTSYIITKRVANTQYEMTINASNEAGNNPSVSAFCYTLAQPPENMSVTSHPSSATLNWTDLGASRYAVERSTGTTTPVNWQFVKVWADNITGSTYQDSGLIGETTYWYRLSSYNGDQVLNSTTSNVVTAHTLVRAPTNLYANVLNTTNIVWNWTDDSNMETGFKIYTSTNGLLTTLGANTTFWPEINLSTNTQYRRYVSAYNEAGENPSNSVSTYTFTAIPSGLTASTNTAHTLILAWNGNGGTRYKVICSTNSNYNPAWKTLNWDAGITASPYTLNELQPETTFYVAVFGYNGDQVVTVGSATATGTTPAITENVIPAGGSGTQTTTKSVNGVNVQISVEVLTGATTVQTYVEITNDPVNNPKEANKTILLSAINKIAADQGKTMIQDTITEFNLYDYATGDNNTGTLGAGVKITFTYPDTNNDGIVDGTNPPLRAEDLRVFTLNEATGEFEIVGDGGVLDKANHTITVTVTHFSVYALVGIGSAAQNLDNVKVYPNPLNTKLYALTIANLTAEAEIKIYNIAGELIKKVEYTTGNGQTTWDGKNDSGSLVASGVYIVYIKSDFGSKKIKVAVEK